MNQEAVNQLFNAAQGGDWFALAACGVLLYEGTDLPRDTNNGVNYLQMASNQNVLWAKDMLMCIKHVNQSSNVRRNAIVSTDAANQLRNYADQGNVWAKTILAEAMYTGYGMPQDRTQAILDLRMATVHGNLWAADILNKIQNTSSPTNTISSSRNLGESPVWDQFRHRPKQKKKTNYLGFFFF